MPKDNVTPILPPRVSYPAMCRFMVDLAGRDSLAVFRYREALALDALNSPCPSCDAVLPPFTLCAEIRCIALRQNARVRRVTVAC